MDVERVARFFPVIGVSLDTVDMAEADRIGRTKLATVMDNLARLSNLLTPSRLIIHTVNYGQPLGDLKACLRDLGLTRHIIQNLQ
jgi:hypothetical protein